MAEYEKKVRVVLKEHGCSFVRHGKGDHDIWYSPITGINVTVDGKISGEEVLAYGEAIQELRDVVAAAYELEYAEEETDCYTSMRAGSQ